MAVALADIERGVKYKFALRTLGKTELDFWISRAVRFYGRYNMNIKRDTLTSEAEEDTYELPDDCVDVIGIYYQDALATGELSMANLSRLGTVEKEYAGDLTIRNIDEDTGQIPPYYVWHQEGNNVIFDDKFALAGEEMLLVYSAEHILDDEEEDEVYVYSTIPSVDVDLLVDLTFAELLFAQAANAGATEDRTVGLESLRTSAVVANTMMTIVELRKGTIAKYGGAVGLI